MTTSRWFCSRVLRSATTDLNRAILLLSTVAICGVTAAYGAASHGAPDWMQATASKLQPRYDDKTDAVLLYSETSVIVVSRNKTRVHVREAYRILRPEGRDHGNFSVFTSGRKKITFMRAWCIPTHGQDYEVTEKEAVEQSPLATAGGLFLDSQRKSIRIPAPDPGSVVGYEYETEEEPFFLQDKWDFQGFDPVLESHYRLELPRDWHFKASWINHAAIDPAKTGSSTWEWTVTDVRAIRRERQMPPLAGVAAKMVISFLPPSGAPDHNAFTSWNDIGQWYTGLVSQRLEPSGPIKQEVTTLTNSQGDALARMQAVAQFIQTNIRYVAIELGIGGWQPRSASDVFTNRYGDCKDKATLTIAMMRELGIESYYVIINARRDAVGADDPAYNGFNHAVTAIKLPDNLDPNDPALVATLVHPKLGRLLFFDPTDEVTPFGRIRGELQSNYGLLVRPDGGELIRLPLQGPALNGVKRLGRMAIEEDGTLYGEVEEIRTGDRAAEERNRLRAAHTDSDKLKFIEALLSESLGRFKLTGSRLDSVADRSRPLGINYAFQAPEYGKNAGDLLLVRPRVLGSKSSGLLETDEPRRFAIEFDSPSRDSDSFEITLPAGYEVADMAAPVDVDFGFANYHSKTELSGNTLRYVRTFEVKDVSVPASKADQLKKLYRIVATDERNIVVLKRNSGRKVPLRLPIPRNRRNQA